MRRRLVLASGSTVEGEDDVVLTAAQEEINRLRGVAVKLADAVRANHAWHQAEGNRGDLYPESTLSVLNTEALLLDPSRSA